MTTRLLADDLRRHSVETLQDENMGASSRPLSIIGGPIYGNESPKKLAEKRKSEY
jgi:hypothetical protein